jgi:hypothetical protein
MVRFLRRFLHRITLRRTYLTIMKKINFFMTVQWLIFMPLILPLGIITGAFEGIKKTFEQASSDILEKQEVVS